MSEPAAPGGLSAVARRQAVPQSSVRAADPRGGALGSSADGGVVAGVRVLPAGVPAVSAAAVLRVHLRVGQLRDGSPAPPRGVRRGCGRWPRVSFFSL